VTCNCGDCGNAVVGPYTADQCVPCWMRLNRKPPGPDWKPPPVNVVGQAIIPDDPRYAPITPDTPTNDLSHECIHLGKVLERTDADGTRCNCAHRWLRACSVFGTCQWLGTRKGVANCATCKKYET